MKADMRPQALTGCWLSGTYAGQTGVLRDVRAGRIYGELADGTEVSGHPCEFRADTGQSGESLLASLLPPPRADHFFAGALRESLAGIYSTAVFGRADTRAWDRKSRYIVDDGEGNAAIAAWSDDGIVAAMCDHDSTRAFEFGFGIPDDKLRKLSELIELPFLRTCTVTAVLWSEQERLEGPEPWFKIYQCGGEIFRSELLNEDEWMSDAVRNCGLDIKTASMIVSISRRAIPLQVVELTDFELGMILPTTAAHRAEAREQLESGGMFIALGSSM